jgi:iron complex outermembrane receptor protein
MRVGNRFAAISALGALTPFIPQTALSQVLLEQVVIETQAGGGAAQQDKADPSTAIDGYVAGSTPTGTKTNTPLREIPQSVSVVTRDQIEDRGADSLAEAIAYSSGVAITPYGLDSRFDQFIIRGFEQNTTGVYRDGLRLPTFSFTGFRIEPYGVDHIDIMRGPTSTLYGLNNPGGLVNVVSKMPTGEEFGEVWASIGTHEAYATGFDVGGVADNGAVAYRITGLIRDADTQVDFVEDDRIFIAPAVTFKPSDATTFTVLASYQKDNTGDTFQLLPAEAVRNGTISRDTFLGEPDYSKFNGEQWGVGYQFEHKFDPAVTFRQNLRYDHASTDYHTIYPQDGGALFGAPDGILLAGQDADETVGVFQVDNHVQIDSKSERIKNTLLLGFDYSHFTSDNELGYGIVVREGGIVQNPSNPTYGPVGFLSIAQAIELLGGGTPIPQSTAPSTLDQTLTQETAGIYVQDQVKFDDHWVLTLGGRYDWVDSELKDHKFDDTINNPLDTRADDSASSNDEAFTYRVGLNYLFDNGLTPYVSYSTSFFPVPVNSSGGAPLEPEEGEQIEAGIKYQPAGSKSWVLVSVFDLTKQNVTQASVDAPGTFVQVGEVQVRGIELEGTIDFDNGWKLLGAYSYWDAEITDDDNPAIVGNRPERIPEHIAALWLDYTFLSGDLKGLGIGAGIRYFGDTFGDNANNFAVPSHTLVDAAVRYQWDNWNLSVSVSNLFDEDYVGTCGAVTLTGADPYEYCSYGNGRVATARISYRW